MIKSWTAAYRNIGYGLIGPAVLALLPPSGRAVAQAAKDAGAVRVHLTVDADAQCATPEALAAQVRKRSQRIEFVSVVGDMPQLRVTIGARGARDRVAELAVQWPDGRRAERQLTAASCAAAVDALALLVAMTLDPAALDDTVAREAKSGGRGTGTGPKPSPSPNPGPSPSPSPGPSPGPSPNADTRAPESEPEPEPESEPGPESESEPGSESESESGSEPEPEPEPEPEAGRDADARAFGFDHVAVGASARLVAGPAPSAMPGFGLYGLVVLKGEGPWAPALGLQLTREWVYGLSETGGDADFELEGAALQACPLGVELSPFSAHACAATEIGRLTASGSNSYAPQTHNELWASLGGTLLFSLGLGGVAELQAGFGAARPLRRYDFAFRPDVFHRVPGVCWEGHLGAGMRFP